VEMFEVEKKMFAVVIHMVNNDAESQRLLEQMERTRAEQFHVIAKTSNVTLSF
jgi:uncharacterized protein YdbL (DUF1318 family)